MARQIEQQLSPGKVVNERSVTFSVYCGYGKTGRAILEDIKKSADSSHRSVSNFIIYLFERYRK